MGQKYESLAKNLQIIAMDDDEADEEFGKESDWKRPKPVHPDHPAVHAALAKFRKNIAKLRQQTQNAWHFWKQWWAIAGTDTDEFHLAKIKFGTHFEISRVANYRAYWQALILVYDYHKDSVNLPKLIKQAAEANLFDLEFAVDVHAELERLGPMINLMRDLRGIDIAHLSETKDYAAVVGDRRVTHFEMRDFIKNSWELLNKAAVAMGDSYHHLTDNVADETVELLQFITQHMGE